MMAARLSDPVSGRVLQISTNQPGIQFYNGKYLDGSAIGRRGTPHGPRAGLCLEPQNFPDAPNHSNFPESRLDPGEVYINRVVYKFAAHQSIMKIRKAFVMSVNDGGGYP
jgi:aldose 1-epimerase